MEIKRVPQCSVNHMPDIPKVPPLLIDAGRRHHETDPRVGEEHEQCSDDVQDHRHAQMDPLQEALSHLVPAIVVDVESSALRHKHQCVDVHDRTEDARQI